MKNYIWKHRTVLGLLVILLVQVPFVAFKLTAATRETLNAFVEIAHVLFTSGLAGYVFSKTFESLLEKRLYGELRRNWKEVRVIYSDDVQKGMGEAYPREPTLLIQAPAFEDPGPESPEDTPENSLFAQSLDGRGHCITAPIMHGPMLISFNNGDVDQPAAGENTYVTGKWSELQLMQVGPSGRKLTRAGFPDTLITLGRAPTRS